MEITEDHIKEFIEKHLDVTDFGYLIIPDDIRLNEEALAKIRQEFTKFIKSQQ